MKTQTPEPLPKRDAMLSLREVTTDTLGKILRLRVNPGQEEFVADNATSIAEAHFEPHAWFRAVYADETPVGFVMLYIDEEKSIYYLWRFMIDKRYQHLGFGHRALRQVIDYVRTLPKAKELSASCVLAEGGPLPFYQKLGFEDTGIDDDDERVIVHRF